MDKTIFTSYNLKEDKLVDYPGRKEDTIISRVLVVTCDTIIYRAREYAISKEGKFWPILYIDEETGKPIHNICQVEELNLSWRKNKESRLSNPAFD